MAKHENGEDVSCLFYSVSFVFLFICYTPLKMKSVSMEYKNGHNVNIRGSFSLSMKWVPSSFELLNTTELPFPYL